MGRRRPPGIAFDQGRTAAPALPPSVLAIADIDVPPSLADKVAFLGSPAAYPGFAGAVGRRETHMSWVFFAGAAVYKLKKPVRFAYLDFSTLSRREAACRAEFTLNRRLAPGVYEGVVPLVRRGGDLHLGGAGEIVDWLVAMRRLDESHTLETRLIEGRLAPDDLDGLVAVLTRFYRTASRVRLEPAARLVRWRRALVENEAVLLDPALDLPAPLVRRLTALERRFLARRREMLARRPIVDGHGDLRPEHIWIGSAARIIDRLEFSAELRAVDPADELAFLDLECERLGRADVGRRLADRVLAGLGGRPPEPLYLFYRIYRALLRARLSIAHLLEAEPRTPEKWPRQARAYLVIALRDARRLEALIRRPSCR